MTRVFLGLGSNVGDRSAHIGRALDALGARRVSSTYETSPIGPSRRPFLNCCAEIRTALSPMGLLVECKRLEALAGRRPGPRWGPRPLDIDILAYGRVRARTPWLVLPHPRVLRRRFVLAGLAELEPRFRAALRRIKDPSQKVIIYFSRGREA